MAKYYGCGDRLALYNDVVSEKERVDDILNKEGLNTFFTIAPLDSNGNLDWKYLASLADEDQRINRWFILPKNKDLGTYNQSGEFVPEEGMYNLSGMDYDSEHNTDIPHCTRLLNIFYSHIPGESVISVHLIIIPDLIGSYGWAQHYSILEGHVEMVYESDERFELPHINMEPILNRHETDALIRNSCITKTNGSVYNPTQNYHPATKKYVDDSVSTAISGLDITDREIVQQLPTQNISTSTIYMVPSSSPGAQDTYTEYMYINNTWEKIGNTDIDLSNYLSKTNTTSYTPTANYHPATKKYVDDNISNDISTVDFTDVQSVTDLIDKEGPSLVYAENLGDVTSPGAVTVIPTSENSATIFFDSGYMDIAIDEREPGEYEIIYGEVYYYATENMLNDYATKEYVDKVVDFTDVEQVESLLADAMDNNIWGVSITGANFGSNEDNMHMNIEVMGYDHGVAYYNGYATEFYLITDPETGDVTITYEDEQTIAFEDAFDNYLAKDNTTAYTPSGNYNPATKLYVDNLISSVVAEQYPIYYVDGISFNTTSTPWLTPSLDDIEATIVSKIQEAYDNEINEFYIVFRNSNAANPIQSFPVKVNIDTTQSTPITFTNYKQVASVNSAGATSYTVSLDYGTWSISGDTVSHSGEHVGAYLITNSAFNYLAKDNRTYYAPVENYNPATKKYVDDTALTTAYQLVGLSAYNSSNTYNLGDYCYYQDTIYKCNDDNVTGTWDSTKWVSKTYLQYMQYIMAGSISY